MTSITVYDGLNTIGGNKIFVEENGKGVFLDFGYNFARYGAYYHNFMRDRSIRGIHDLIFLDLIPKLDIYRPDLIPSDLTLSSYPSLDIEAVLLSHSHMDHYGNIGLLKGDIPVVASGISLALLKSIQDTGQSKLGLDIAYHDKRSPKAVETRVLESNKGDNRGISKARDFFCTEPFKDSLRDFLTLKSRSGKEIDGGSLGDLNALSTQFEIQGFEVDHSIYGSTAYLLKGDTTIAYTGDFRLHGKRADKSKDFINHAKSASVLIIEGTRVSREAVNDSEKTVFDNCLKAVEETDGLVVADFSARNLERLEIFEKIASKTGRKLVMSAKEAYLLLALDQVDNLDRLEDILVYKELSSRKNYWQASVLEKKTEIAYVGPVEIRNELENYIVCFSFYDMNRLLDIKPDKGSYIFSSCEAFEEESEFDFIRLHRWLDYFGFKIYGFKIDDSKERPKPEFTKEFHASGHVGVDQIRWAIDTIDPEVIIPVHTTDPGWFKRNYDNTVMLKAGEKINI